MGEAKIRGTLEERIAAVHARNAFMKRQIELADKVRAEFQSRFGVNAKIRRSGLLDMAVCLAASSTQFSFSPLADYLNAKNPVEDVEAQYVSSMERMFTQVCYSARRVAFSRLLDDCREVSWPIVRNLLAQHRGICLDKFERSTAEDRLLDEAFAVFLSEDSWRRLQSEDGHVLSFGDCTHLLKKKGYGGQFSGIEFWITSMPNNQITIVGIGGTSVRFTLDGPTEDIQNG